MTIIEQIKAEIERRIKIQDDWIAKGLQGGNLALAVREELKQLLSSFSTLERPKDMKWHNINEPPKQWERIVLLCEGGRIIFNGEFNGEDFTVWDDENGIWTSPKDETVVAWMPQKEVEEYLKELIHFRP